MFQLVANGRRAKNFIPDVHCNGNIYTEQYDKEVALFASYDQLLGKEQCQDHTLDSKYLQMERQDLQELDLMFKAEEIWHAIKDMPPNRAPGPDGFIACFFQKAWTIIKNNVIVVFHKLYTADGRGFGKLNRALIPKKLDAKEIGDFRLISLVHSVPKIFAKALANRLRPRLVDFVCANQSAFIRGHNLHDNFLLVRRVAKRLHN